jgi:predicted enzyme related to lactoylglutathione lyase
MTTQERCKTRSADLVERDYDELSKGVTMATRSKAPLGSPCWTDLWTSDVEGSRKFYSELFSWEAQEPSPEFGGYFMFTRDGVPVAGGMGDMGDMKADNTWKIYLDTPDIAKTVVATEKAGGQVLAPVAPVADLGQQFVLLDSNGAPLGAWQAGTFPGFTVLGEHGSPSWFELLTRDFARAVDFYGSVFSWTINAISDTDEFRYSVLHDPTGEGDLAGIGDATSLLPEGVGDHWSVYWHVNDADAAVKAAKSLGGTVEQDVHDTPYGRLAALRDPSGASFKIRAASA